VRESLVVATMGYIEGGLDKVGYKDVEGRYVTVGKYVMVGVYVMVGAQVMVGFGELLLLGMGAIVAVGAEDGMEQFPKIPTRSQSVLIKFPGIS
jgi:hypothetical protein